MNGQITNMHLTMNFARGYFAGGFHQAEDLATVFIKPIVQIVHTKFVLRLESSFADPLNAEAGQAINMMIGILSRAS
jgi:hypothetical protein